ncbi:MAG: EamA family transporter [Solirubrobacteraceae bacterium]
MLGADPQRTADVRCRLDHRAYSGHAGTDAWLAFAYVSTVSMFIGFFWYAGLARGGVAKAGQVQLLQPLLTLALAGWCWGKA